MSNPTTSSTQSGLSNPQFTTTPITQIIPYWQEDLTDIQQSGSSSGSGSETTVWQCILSIATYGSFYFGGPGLIAAGIFSAISDVVTSEGSSLTNLVSELGTVLTQQQIDTDAGSVQTYLSSFNIDMLSTLQVGFTSWDGLEDTNTPLGSFYAQLKAAVTDPSLQLQQAVNNLMNGEGSNPGAAYLQQTIVPFVAAASIHIFLYQYYITMLQGYTNRNLTASEIAQQTDIPNQADLMECALTIKGYIIYAVTTINTLISNVDTQLQQYNKVQNALGPFGTPYVLNGQNTAWETNRQSTYVSNGLQYGDSLQSAVNGWIQSLTTINSMLTSDRKLALVQPAPPKAWVL